MPELSQGSENENTTVKGLFSVAQSAWTLVSAGFAQPPNQCRHSPEGEDGGNGFGEGWERRVWERLTAAGLGDDTGSRFEGKW